MMCEGFHRATEVNGGMRFNVLSCQKMRFPTQGDPRLSRALPTDDSRFAGHVPHVFAGFGSRLVPDETETTQKNTLISQPPQQLNK